MVVVRHRTLGARVPVRRPGPCRNPDCAAHRKGTEPGGPTGATAPAEATGRGRPGGAPAAR
ncbi:hypothetical protein [Streptomyces sp. TG1A-8]|uniref:hypothetical protein n=1 Tax=Streptomyces sp. TG1A-8 TaxID=3051385 RepID=UPI003463F3FB